MNALANIRAFEFSLFYIMHAFISLNARNRGMRITFLGTSGSMPSKDRGASGVVVKRGREMLMFDCGEGVQQQMVRADIGARASGWNSTITTNLANIAIISMQ